MEKIKVSTAQNVAIEYYLPGVATRVLATVIDLCVFIFYYFLVAFVIGLIGISPGWGLGTLISLPVLLYHFAFEVFNQGQSIGKKLMGIRVVKLDGSQPNLGDYLLRWLLRLVDTNIMLMYGMAGILSVTFSKKGQRLGDMVAGTTVVSLRRDLSLKDTIFAWNPKEYAPTFPQVRNLNRRDISVLKEIVINYNRKEKYELLREAGRKVAGLMGVKPYEMTAHSFLKTVVRDYNFYLSQ